MGEVKTIDVVVAARLTDTYVVMLLKIDHLNSAKLHALDDAPYGDA